MLYRLLVALWVFVAFFFFLFTDHSVSSLVGATELSMILTGIIAVPLLLVRWVARGSAFRSRHQ